MGFFSLFKRRRACASKIHKNTRCFFFFSFSRSVVGTSGLAPSPTSGPLILPVLEFEKPCSLILPLLNLRDDILFILGSISEKKSFVSRINISASLCSARKLIKYSKRDAVRARRNAHKRDFPDFDEIYPYASFQFSQTFDYSYF